MPDGDASLNGDEATQTEQREQGRGARAGMAEKEELMRKLFSEFADFTA